MEPGSVPAGTLRVEVQFWRREEKREEERVKYPKIEKIFYFILLFFEF